MGLFFPSICFVHGELEPVLTTPDQVLWQWDFEKYMPLEKARFSVKQGTRWAVTNGALFGIPSPAEYQAKKADHKGTEARISLVGCPGAFAARMRLRFGAGGYTAATPMVELGHHVTRIQFRPWGVELLAAHEELRLASNTAFTLRTNTWVGLVAEVRGEEVLFQIEDGPVLYGRHPSIETNNHELGLAGFKGGSVEVDDLKVWTITRASPVNWLSVKSTLPSQAAQPVKP